MCANMYRTVEVEVREEEVGKNGILNSGRHVRRLL